MMCVRERALCPRRLQGVFVFYRPIGRPRPTLQSLACKRRDKFRFRRAVFYKSLKTSSHAPFSPRSLGALRAHKDMLFATRSNL
jgi:hypothetical protein